MKTNKQTNIMQNIAMGWGRRKNVISYGILSFALRVYYHYYYILLIIIIKLILSGELINGRRMKRSIKGSENSALNL